MRHLRWMTAWTWAWAWAWVLLVGTGLPSMARAEERAFDVGGQSVALERLGPGVGVYFRAFRPNRSTGRWDVDVVVTNGTGRTLRGPLVLRFETAQGVAPGIQGARLDAAGKAFLDLTPLVGSSGFPPGTALRPWTLSLGDATTRPELSVALFATASNPGTPPLVLVRVLTADGLPAEGTEAEELGPASPRRRVSGRGGWLSLEVGAGVRGWVFRAPGQEPMTRLAAGLDGTGVTELFTVRQVPVDGSGTTRFPSQALPAPLPRGWSPVAMIRGDAGSRELELVEALPSGRAAAWARWDAEALGWRLVDRLTGTGAGRVSVGLPEGGLYAVLVPDVGASGPVLPPVGGLLAGVGPEILAKELGGALRAVGTVDPSSATASREAARVTARARVKVSSAVETLASGLEIPCEVVEEYRLRDGSRRRLPGYTLRLVAFRPLGDPGNGPLVAEFPVRPFQLLAGEELVEARIQVDVLPPGPFPGGVLGPQAGSLTAGTVRLATQDGDLPGAEAVLVREPVFGQVDGLLPPGVTLVKAFELGVGALAPGRRLGVDLGTADPGSSFVLARAVFDAGQHGFQPVLRLASDASGKLAVTEPVAGGLPGVDGGGQFLLLKTTAPEALLEGVARDASGQGRPGLRVRRGPWTALTGASGRFQLLAPAGSSEVRVLDVARGDSGSATVVVPPGLDAVPLALDTAERGPRIVSASPTNNAGGVARVTPVALTFSRPLNPATVLGGAVRLTGPDGTVVPASVSLNVARTVLTLLPETQLAPSARFQVSVAATVADLTARPVEGEREFQFTTESDTLRRADAGLVVHESTGGLVPMVGGPGLAEPESPVILVNETTGITSTVLSKADGSFTNNVAAGDEDELAVVLVNRNGTRNRVTPGRQLFRDGSVGLFGQGGTVEAPGEGGGFRLEIPAGAIPRKTVFKVDAVPLAEARKQLPEPAAGLTVAAAMDVQLRGDQADGPAGVSVPFDPKVLGDVGGASPDSMTFALAIVREVDGQPSYQVVDALRHREGRLVSESQAPFAGWLDGLRQDANPLLQFGGSRGVQGSRRGARPAFVQILLFTEIMRMVVLTAKDRPMLMTGKAGLCLAQGTQGCVEEQLDGLFGEINAGIGLVSQLDLAGDGVAGTLSAIASGRRIPVAGAIIDAVRASVPPRFPTGLPYAVTDRGGRYSLVLPSAQSVYVARARHPSQSTPVMQPVAPFFESQVIAPVVVKNFTFEATEGQLLPPRVYVSQQPINPGVDEPTTLVVDVVHPLASTAQLTVTGVQVRSLAGDTNAPPAADSDLVRGAPTRGTAGTGQQRFSLTLKAGRALDAVLQLRASVTLGALAKTTDETWSVAFGAGSPVANRAIQSDPLDKVGPSLVAVTPYGGATLSAGEPIRLVFNEPIDASITNIVGGIRITPTVPGGFQARLSVDQTVLEVLPPSLAPGTAYELSVQSAVRDLAGNPMQSGALSGLNLKVPFRTPEVFSTALPGIGQGGGAVTHENHAFVLDRAGTGRLVVFDVSTPGAPNQVTSVDLPSFPRDLELVPNWSYYLRPPALYPGEPARTNRTLLLVVGGVVGLRDFFQGNGDAQRQYLRVYDVTNPRQPERIASSELGERPSAVQKVTWHPPQAAFLEVGADFSQVGIVDLQAFINAYNLSLPERVSFGSINGFLDGFDGSGLRPDGTTNTVPNGHYADSGDRVPKWEKQPTEFYGYRFGFGLRAGDGQRQLLDYAYEPSAGLGCVVFAEGAELTVNGKPTGRQLPAGFRVARFLGQDVVAASATFPLAAGARPKRVHVEVGVDVSLVGVPDLRNLAFVSLAPDSDGSPRLLVLDVTDPLAPRELLRVKPPEGLGLPQSVYRLPNGLLALAMTSDALVLDPSLVLSPSPSQGPHPIFRNRLSGAGSGNQTLAVSRGGILASSLGGRSEVVQFEPRLRVMQRLADDRLATNPFTAALAGVGVLRPDSLKADPARVAAVLPSLREVGAVNPATVSGLSSNTPSLLPPHPAAHYHVLLEAPGGAGPEVALGLQSLNRAGLPLRNKGRDFAAVRAVSPNAATAIGQSPRAGCDAPIRALRAFRLSDDPANPAYNTYLSEPFAVVAERIPLDRLQEVQTAMPRVVLWSAHHLSAFIDPSMDRNAVLGPYAARVTGFAGAPGDLSIVPRTSAVVDAFPGTYLPGDQPPPPGGHEVVPGTFGLVNADNGEVRHQTIDLSLPGRGMPVVFERHYGGQDLYEGPFGHGWDFTHNQQVVPLRPQTFGSRSELMFAVARLTNSSGGIQPFARSGDLVFSDGAGHLIPYVNRGASAPPEVASDPLLKDLDWSRRIRTYYLPSTNAPGVFDPIFEFQDGAFARLTPAGEQFWYDGTGRLTKVYGRFPKNLHELVYNERSELVRILDRSIPDGARFLELGYYRLQNDPLFVTGRDARTRSAFVAGKVARLVDYAGRTVDFEYDDDGLLKKRKGIAGSGANGGSSARPETVYLQEGCGGVVGGLSAGGEPSQMDAALFATSVARDTQKVGASGEGLGGKVGMVFPASGNGPRTFTGPDQAKTQMAFDGRGFLTQQVESGPLAGSATNTFRYNADGLATNHVGVLGDATTYVYDSANPNLRARGNLLSVRRSPGPRGGPVLEQSMPTYDLRYNLPVGVTRDENGFSHTHTLRPDGRQVESIVHEKAGETRLDYNEYGQLTSQQRPDGTSIGLDYEPTSGFLKVSRQGDHPTTLLYDGTVAGRLGRPTTVTPPAHDPVQVIYDDRLMPVETRRGTAVRKMGYDANGNLIRREDPVDATRSRVELRQYSRINFLERVTVKGVEVGGSTQDIVTEFVSSPQDAWRVREVRNLASGLVRSFDYDHLGRVVRDAFGTYVEEMDYDLQGNLTILRRGSPGATRVRQTMAYDGHNRPTNIVRRVSADVSETVARTYFAGGQLRSESVSGTGFGEVSRFENEEIDGLGRVKRRRVKGTRTDAVTTMDYPSSTSGGSMVADGPRDRTEVGHDAAGYQRSLVNHLASVAYTPDANGNTVGTISSEGGRSYTSSASFNGLDQLDSVSDDLGLLVDFDPRLDGANERVTDGRRKSTTQDFTILGELRQRRRPNRVEFNFRQDANRQSTFSGDVALKGNEMAYDRGTGRPTELRLRNPASVFLFQSPNDLDLPTRVVLPGGSMLVGYDDQGRVVSRDASYVPGLPYKLTARHDALGRIREVHYGTDGRYAASYGYDLLGTLTEAHFDESHGRFDITADVYEDGTRRSLTYPSGKVVIEERDPAGRLVAVRDQGGGDLYRVTRHAGVHEREEVALGNGRILESARFDTRRRMTARAFRRDTGEVLADVRYRYDEAGNVVARQEVHRHGRADLYRYDDGGRLERADFGLRPVLQGARRTSTAGLQSDFQLEFGHHARTYAYDGQGFDLLEKVTTLAPNPLAIAPIPFVQTMVDPDGMLVPRTVDGVARSAPDPMGNITNTVLGIARPGGGVDRVDASLRYTALSQLAFLGRADGLTVDYEHQPDGLVHRRRVRDGVRDEDVALVWDQGRLLEEHLRQGGTNVLQARYYYADEDSPFAVDLRDPQTGKLGRFWYLRDALSSVVALADDAGTVVERYRYDPWGRPVIEGRDGRPPQVAVVAQSSGSLLVQFSEPVLPPYRPAAPGSVPGVEGSLAVDPMQIPNAFIRVQTATGLVPGRLELEEDLPGGFGFGTVFRLTPSNGEPILGLRVDGGAVVDEWGNTNLTQLLTFSGAGGSQPLFQAPGAQQDTRPPQLARSAFGSPMLFHGQFWDADAGLLYLRARFYDPGTGTFLQQDPMGYEDSPNLYLAFAGNPTTMSDNSGLNAESAVIGISSKLRRLTALENNLMDAEKTAVTVGRAARKADSQIDRVFASRPASSTLGSRMVDSHVAPSQPKPIDTAFVQLRERGRRLDSELRDWLSQARREGRVRVRYEDLAPHSYGKQDYDPVSGISTITLNSKFKGVSDRHTQIRLRLTLLHEVSHARQAIATHGMAQLGMPRLIEEFSAHKDELALEYYYRGLNASYKSKLRQSFEINGNRGVIDYLFGIDSYRSRFTPTNARNRLGRTYVSYEEMRMDLKMLSFE